MAEQPAPRALFPHQEALLTTFFSPEHDRTLVLRADVGLGKTAALVALVSRFMRERPQARVLVLQPAGALRSQFAARLADAGVPVIDVDRYRFRELRDAGDGDGIWPAGLTVVMSQDFAAQPDIQSSLASTRWELLVVDEAQAYLGAGASGLVNVEQASERVVLATAIPLVAEARSGRPQSTLVEWRYEAIAAPASRGVGPRLDEVRFELSTEERRVVATLRELGQGLGIEGPHRFLASVVESAIRSSPAAAEAVLRRFTDRSVKVPGDLEDVDDQSLLEETNEPSLVASAPEATRRLAARAVAEMEGVGSDSKLASLRGLLSELIENGKQVCVLTSYVRTLYYLAADAESLTVGYRLLHGAMTAEDRERSLTEFLRGNKILIATEAAIVDDAALEKVTDLVLYDLPRATRDRLETLIRRFDRLGRSTQLVVHVLAQSGDQDPHVDAALAALRQVVGGKGSQ